MESFGGKVAVVTGGASGIGRAIALRLAREGARIVLADVEKTALDATAGAFAQAGFTVTGVVTDVSNFDSVRALADRVYEEHGAVHLLFNNAGIGTDERMHMIWDAPESDWRWAFSVNVWGVLHGIRAFVPRMIAGGQEGHVVNTSSGNGGLYPIPTTPIYATTKAAVTTISETLRLQLEMSGARVRASVLFPGPHIVRTNIFSAGRNRPASLPMEREPSAPPPTLEEIGAMIESMGMPFGVTEPEEVAEHAVEGVRADRFWILPPSEDIDQRLRDRCEDLLARRNPPLKFF